MSYDELQRWEKALNFSSLLALAAEQSLHPEQLERAGTPTPAYNLLKSFGILTFYGAAISPNGEYQIENTIYRFHEGFKYQAKSESELQQLKQNPAPATEKPHAGSQRV